MDVILKSDWTGARHIDGAMKETRTLYLDLPSAPEGKFWAFDEALVGDNRCRLALYLEDIPGIDITPDSTLD